MGFDRVSQDSRRTENKKARNHALRDPHKSALINQHHISVGSGEVIKNGAQHRSL